MMFLVVKAWIAFVRYEVMTRSKGYRAVEEVARRERNLKCAKGDRRQWQQVCEAVEIAGVLYFKEVHCLQRSSVTAELLRGDGWDAHLVVGVQMIPFASHAWVELDGNVINDKPYMREKYCVLDQSRGSAQ